MMTAPATPDTSVTPIPATLATPVTPAAPATPATPLSPPTFPTSTLPGLYPMPFPFPYKFSPSPIRMSMLSPLLGEDVAFIVHSISTSRIPLGWWRPLQVGYVNVPDITALAALSLDSINKLDEKGKMPSNKLWRLT
jgi:hypothetical protein